jgi:CubicO group peptidase (beta-lactamase class C family)
MRRLLISASLSILSVFASIGSADDSKTVAWVPDQEILDELKSAPRDNVARVERLRELYIQAGARPEDIRLQEVTGRRADDPVLHNVIVTKAGTSDSVIVVGGHLDKVSEGDGIIDDWSGACLASNLYQTIRERPTAQTFIFIGFAYEEQGLVGSRAYVESLSDVEKKKIRAMVNLECLGVDDPFIWTNGSTDSLEVIAHQVADEYKVPLRDHKIFGVAADSIPFDRVGIPNITFDGMALDHFGFIHSDKDKFSNIQPEAYLNAYRVASRFLVTLDRRLGENPNLLITLDPKTATRVDEYVEGERTKRHIPGLSVAVVQNGELVLAKGYGQANVELDAPCTADTVYQIGSITKQFTATAIMALVEEGKMALDDPIAKYLDNTPETWKDITVRHLLNHTSGIKSYTNVAENMAKVRLDRTRDDIIGTVRDLPLEFVPGDKWVYNNTGYFLLGLIIEKVSGKAYAEFLQERIFKPLDMNATRVNELQDIVKQRATGYAWSGKLQNAEHASMSWPFSAGAIVSTVADLAKWDTALCSEKTLKRTSLDQMWTKTKLNGGKETEYGFGWGVSDYRGHKLIGHGGGIHGFTTDIARFVNDKLTVVVLTNLSGPSANPAAIARGIAAIYIPDLSELAQKAVEDKDPKMTEFFKKLVQDTIDGKLDPDLFTEEMQKLIFPDRVNQAAQFLKSLGEQRSFILVETKEQNEVRVYRYQLTVGDTTILLTGTIGQDGKVSGFALKPE